MNLSHANDSAARLERALLTTGGKICSTILEPLAPTWLYVEFFELHTVREYRALVRRSELTPNAPWLVSAARITRGSDGLGPIDRKTYLSEPDVLLLLADGEYVARELYDRASGHLFRGWPVLHDRFTNIPGRRMSEVH